MLTESKTYQEAKSIHAMRYERVQSPASLPLATDAVRQVFREHRNARRERLMPYIAAIAVVVITGAVLFVATLIAEAIR